MNADHEQIALIVARDGLIKRSEHPDLSNQIAWLARSGRLVSVLKDFYTSPDRAGDPEMRMLALSRAVPAAVLVGPAAARLGYDPARSVAAVSAALPYLRSMPVGFKFCHRSIPADLIRTRQGIRFSAPALTALDLVDTEGGDAIDDVLRRRAATLPQLRRALVLTPGRRGNCRRRAVLLDSRDEPWSAAERRLHRILRKLGYRGWMANAKVVLGGFTYFLDVAFARQRVAVEMDGRLIHSDRSVFEADRQRQNLLVAADWRVVRFTWLMLDDVDLVRRTLRSVLGSPRAASLDSPFGSDPGAIGIE